MCYPPFFVPEFHKYVRLFASLSSPGTAILESSRNTKFLQGGNELWETEQESFLQLVSLQR